jgi:hypothetical protein
MSAYFCLTTYYTKSADAPLFSALHNYLSLHFISAVSPNHKPGKIFIGNFALPRI